MARTLYISHPEVLIDPLVPVPEWGLSEKGATRAKTFAAQNYLPQNSVFISSNEVKAVELAQILANTCQGTVIKDALLGENDRSATGFLPQEEFEATADQFFAHPGDSIRGWERAIDAQKRVVERVNHWCTLHKGAAMIVFCGHGGVGSLLKCAIKDCAISRREDQQDGGGNLFAFDFAQQELLCDWTPMENWMGFIDGSS